MSLLAKVKHLAQVNRSWAGFAKAGEPDRFLLHPPLLWHGIFLYGHVVLSARPVGWLPGRMILTSR